MDTLPLLYATVPGKVAGIIAVDPYVVQCHDCGATQECPRPADLILCGYRFHVCEGPTGIRRCRECNARVLTACTHRSHAWEVR
jgi:hypothetical protein